MWRLPFARTSLRTRGRFATTRVVRNEVGSEVDARVELAQNARMLRVFVVSLVLSAVACKSTPPPENVGVTPHAGGSDKCLAFARGCPGSADDDGCPEQMIALGPDCTLAGDAEKQVATAAQEVMNEADLTRLAIVAPSPNCGDAVRARFEEAGVPPTRLETRTDTSRSFVSFQVLAWKGVVCH